MNKTIALCGLSALLALGACTKGQDAPTQEVQITSAVHVQSADGQSATASLASFSFVLSPYEGLLNVSCQSLSLGNGVTANFTSGNMPMEFAQFPGGINYAFDHGASASGTQASGIGGNIVGSYNVYEGEGSQLVPLTRGRDLLLLSATVDGRKINTFPADCFYKGLTVTSVVGSATQGFQTEDVIYGVSIDLAKSKATVVMYNVQLNPAMPKIKAIVLENLDFVLTPGGYRIEGSNVVPGVVEGGATTPNPTYTFGTFQLATRQGDEITKSDFTSVAIQYTVAGGRFEGKFTGRWPNVYANAQ